MKIPNKFQPPNTPNRRIKNLRFQVILRDGKRCRHCGQKNPNRLTTDHIVARAFGGTDEVENLQILCYPCHRRKDRAIPQLIEMAKTGEYTRLSALYQKGFLGSEVAE